MRWISFAVFAGLLSGRAPVARADAPDATATAVPAVPRWGERSWAVRGEAFVIGSGELFGPTAGAPALSFQKVFFRRLAWEETVGYGVGNRKVDGKDTGWTLAGTLRFAAWTNQARTSALTTGLGTALLFGGGYGTLNFAFAELGYEYRSRPGFTLLAALGPNILMSRPKVTCDGAGWFCEDWKRGRIAPVGHVRLGAGWTF